MLVGWLVGLLVVQNFMGTPYCLSTWHFQFGDLLPETGDHSKLQISFAGTLFQ